MVTLESMTTFLGWCTVINVGLFVVAFGQLMLLRNWATSFHAKMFGMEESQVRAAYFQFLANYKLAIFVFNLVPYLALKLMQ